MNQRHYRKLSSRIRKSLKEQDFGCAVKIEVNESEKPVYDLLADYHLRSDGDVIEWVHYVNKQQLGYLPF